MKRKISELRKLLEGMPMRCATCGKKLKPEQEKTFRKPGHPTPHCEKDECETEAHWTDIRFQRGAFRQKKGDGREK